MIVAFTPFWKCNFPMNHNVCLSVQKHLSEFLYVRILGKCRLLLLTLPSPMNDKEKWFCEMCEREREFCELLIFRSSWK